MFALRRSTRRQLQLRTQNKLNTIHTTSLYEMKQFQTVANLQQKVNQIN